MLQVRRPAFTVLTMLSWNEADSQLVYILFSGRGIPPFYVHITFSSFYIVL
ncbi:MAG: hypothetical protein WDO19_11830 [Bacteroidota bacterium]